MTLIESQNRKLDWIKNHAQTLFNQVTTYKELNQKPQKTNQEKELQYYLGFRILDSLYKFKNFSDTKFHDENYNQFFNNPPDRNLINTLRNQMLYDVGMNFDQTLLDKISNKIIKEFKSHNSVDPSLQNDGLTNEEKDIYHRSYVVTKDYSKMINNQIYQFRINPDFTKKEILKELKNKSDEMNQKRINAESIVNKRQIKADIMSPNIVDAINSLDNLTRFLIHEEPQQSVIDILSEKITEVSNRLDLAFKFLQKAPEEIANETILKVEAELQKTMNKERGKILKKYDEDFYELQLREKRERRQIEIEENGKWQETEGEININREKIIKNSQRKNLLEGKIAEIKSKIDSIKERKNGLVKEVILNAQQLKSAQKSIESDNNINQAVQILYALFENTVKVENIKSNLLKIINNASGNDHLKTGIVGYFDGIKVLKAKESRKSGSRKAGNEIADLMVQLLDANDVIKTIFECNNKSASITQENLLLNEKLEKLNEEQSNITKQLKKLNQEQIDNSKEELKNKNSKTNSEEQKDLEQKILHQELAKQQKVIQEISNEYYGDETLSFIIKSNKNFLSGDIEYLDTSLTKSSDLLNEALKNFKESNNQKLIIPAFINLSEVSPELTTGHYGVIYIKKDKKRDKVSFIDSTGLNSLNNGFNNHIKEALNSYLNGRESDILISHTQLQGHEKEQDLIIADKNHCGPFVCFIVDGLIDETISLNQYGNLTFKDEAIKDLTKEESNNLGKKIRETHLEFVREGELVNYEEVKNNLKFYDQSQSSTKDDCNFSHEQDQQKLTPSASPLVIESEKFKESPQELKDSRS